MAQVPQPAIFPYKSTAQSLKKKPEHFHFILKTQVVLCTKYQKAEVETDTCSKVRPDLQLLITHSPGKLNVCAHVSLFNSVERFPGIQYIFNQLC